jgi:Putative MetA-pathway of phenol degradation
MTARRAVCQLCFAIAGSIPASAHHAGGVGNALGAGPIVTISADTLDQDHSVAAITLNYQSLGGLSTETLLSATSAMPPGPPESNNVHDLRTIQAYAISYAYGLTNDFTVAVTLPYVRRTGIREAVEQDNGELEVENFGPADGIGDLTLFGQYRFFNRNHTELAALFGLTTPTGRTNAHTAQGEPFDAEFQPGTGAWEPLMGLAWTHHEGKLSFDTNVLYALSTEGIESTTLGNRFQYNFAVSYHLTSLGSGEHPMFHGAEPHEEGDDGHHHEHESTGPSLDLVLELNGEWHAEQVTNGIADPNSGGNMLFLSPGLRLSQDKWSSIISVGIPIVDDLNGIQSEPDWRIIAGATWLFEPQ